MGRWFTQEVFVTAVVQIGIFVGGLIGGYIIAMRQVKVAHKNATRLTREEAGREIALRAADESLSYLSNVRQQYDILGAFVPSLVISLKLSIDHDLPLGPQWNQPNMAFINHWTNASRAIIAFGFMFESRQVALHPFVEMKEELLKKNLELMQSTSATADLISRVYYENIVPNVKVPLGTVDNLQRAADELTELCADVKAYVYDFVVELQNVYISPLFGYEMPRRDPPDRRHKVLRPVHGISP